MKNTFSLVGLTQELNTLARLNGYGLTSVTAECRISNDHLTGEPLEHTINVRACLANMNGAIAFEGANPLEVSRQFRAHFYPVASIKTDDVEIALAA
jgi:hypothetical protein